MIIERYFKRTGYAGPLDASGETLSGLLLAQLQTIPFENLDPFFGAPPSIELASIADKLLDRRRGGYCFENNALLAHVLDEIGFPVRRLLARVRWNLPDATPTQRTHMALLVSADGADFIADAGFGSASPSAPLRLANGLVQETPHGTYRLTDTADDWLLEMQVHDEWKPVYRFDLQPQQPIDYEAPNWYTATHPKSHFTFSLIATRISGRERIVLANNVLSRYRGGEAVERADIRSFEEMARHYQECFGLALPDDARSRARVENVLRAA